jgi:hypothetical protein
MMTRRFRIWTALALALAVGSGSYVLGAQADSTLPTRLSDKDYWKLIADLSEPNGKFQSENLLSNETRLQYVIPELVVRAKPGGAYMGVGPEQNFTLIAALKPSMAFIVDIRRGNLQLHLLYKALFELSPNRVEFVSRLFSRPKPSTLRAGATPAEIFAAFTDAAPSESLYRDNLKAVQTQLVTRHGFALSAEDVAGVEYVYKAFFSYGPNIQYSSSDGFAGSGEPNYVTLMLATDAMGQQRGYLTNDEAFAAVKDLETRNALVPLVGDFAGPKAIRAVGQYLRERNVTVSAFYLSNVEQYLRLFRTWPQFCANAQTLPVNADSTFIRAGRGGRVGRGNTMTAELAPISAELQFCATNTLR